MPLCRDSDEELMRRIVRRDGDAMNEFRDRYYRVVIATGVRMLRDRSDAEDVAQDVLTRVWVHAHAYEHTQGSLVTWLSQITRNRAIDLMRQNSAWRQRHVHATDRCSDIDVESLMTTNRDAEVLRSALASLPDSQRVLLEHAYYRGSSHSELARSFGLPLGTVKTRIRTGLAALKRGFARRRLFTQKGPAWRSAVGV